MTSMPVVSIAHSNNLHGSPLDLDEQSLMSVFNLTKKAVDKCCNLDKLVKDKTVMLKPNFVRSITKDIFATTDLRLVYSVAKMTIDAKAKKVMIGDKPGWKKTSRTVFNELGIERITKLLDVEICYFDEETLVPITAPNANIFSEALIPKSLAESEVLINLPKVKTHMHTIVSLGIKNMHGIILDDQRLISHRNDLSYKLVDILKVKKPSLTVSDCIWPMEGQGPLNGQTLKDINVVLSGTDIVAVDAVTSLVMGIDPSEIDTIRIAQSQGIGCADISKIKVVGSKIEAVRRYFKRPWLSSAGVYPNVLSIERGVCTGCLSCVRHSLDRLAFEKTIDRIGKITVCSGRHALDEEKLLPFENDIWLLGDCACEESVKKSSGKKIHKVTGCPPHIYEFYNALVAKYLKSEEIR